MARNQVGETRTEHLPMIEDYYERLGREPTVSVALALGLNTMPGRTFRVITQQHDDVIHLTEPRQFNPALPGLCVCYCVLSRGEMVRPVGKTGEDAFFAIARAQYEMHLASQNVDVGSSGVRGEGRGAHEALKAWVGQRDTVSTRASSIPGWQVVSIPKEHAQEFASCWWNNICPSGAS